MFLDYEFAMLLIDVLLMFKQFVAIYIITVLSFLHTFITVYSWLRTIQREFDLRLTYICQTRSNLLLYLFVLCSNIAINANSLVNVYIIIMKKIKICTKQILYYMFTLSVFKSKIRLQLRKHQSNSI